MAILSDDDTVASTSPATIRYSVDLTHRAQHLVVVTMHIPASIASKAEVAMATWTPGSYFERHYARHVQQLQVATAEGEPLAFDRPDAHTWCIDADGGSDIEVSFELYAHELGVRNNHVDDHHALLIGASTFAFVRGQEHLEHRVHFLGDERVWSLLPSDGDEYVAEDFLHLVDSAFDVGEHRVARWTTAGIPHELVWAAHGGHPNLESIADWAAKITDTAVELFGELPVKDKYTFISVGSDQGAGGLEHRDGSVLMMPVTTFQELDRLTTYQSLVAHEYLHLWNVKRLVPVALINPDLTTPAHTESLWVAEGWTAFYDEVLPVRAGVWTAPAYLAMAATQAHSVLQRPGAQLQSVRRASHEAWVKQYIRDENTPNVGVNYYGHGAVLAWCIDLLIREAAPGGAGLDDAFRLLWQRFGRTGRGYTERDVQDAVNEAAGTNLDAFFDEYVEAPSLPPIKALVDVVGLRFAPATENLVPHLGAVVADENGLVRLTNVLRGGPAWEAGLSGGDLLLSLNGQRVGVGRLDVHLFALTPGEPVDVAVFRGSRMLHHTVHLGTHQAPDRLVRVPAPDDRQRAAYRSWLGANLDDISAV